MINFKFSDNDQISKNRFTMANIVLFLFGILTVLNILGRSTFSFDNKAIKIAYVVVILMFLISLFLTKHSNYEYLWMIIGLIIGIENFLITSQIEFLMIILLLFSTSEMSPEKLLKMTMYIISISLLVLFILSSIGMIPNLPFYRNNVVRWSFGTHFPLVLSGYLFLFCAIVTVLYGKRYTFRTVVLLLLIILWLEKFVNARNDELCILFLILVNLLNSFKNKYLKYISYISFIFTIVFTLGSVFISELIPYTSLLFTKLNDVLSGRLQLQHTLFQYYNPSFLGLNIAQKGMGGLVSNTAYYFYIDNSFCRYLFMGGIGLFVFIVYTFFKSSFQLIKAKRYIIGMVELILCINGVIADPLASLSGGLLLPIFMINIRKFETDF